MPHTHTHTHTHMYVCIIFPHLLKIYQINKNGINVVLYLFVIIYIYIYIYTCYLWNIYYFFQHFKILRKILKLFKHHNVLSNFIMSSTFLFIYNFLFNSLNVMIYKILKKFKLYDQIFW
jgi:hypothetical protein